MNLMDGKLQMFHTSRYFSNFIAIIRYETNFSWLLLLSFLLFINQSSATFVFASHHILIHLLAHLLVIFILFQFEKAFDVWMILCIFFLVIAMLEATLVNVIGSNPANINQNSVSTNIGLFYLLFLSFKFTDFVLKENVIGPSWVIHLLHTNLLLCTCRHFK